MTTAEGLINSCIERILRLKEEQDATKSDIRDVYAEAKGQGLDKTALGLAVNALRKREKIGVAAFDEENTIVDLYLSAFLGTGTVHATRAHEEASPATDRKDRARARTSESMADIASFAQESADKGLISQEAAAETKRLADAISEKLGVGASRGE